MTRWIRIKTLGIKCPVCDRADWCMISDDRWKAICARVESSKRCGEAGWLHNLRGEDTVQERPVARMPSRLIRDLSMHARHYAESIMPAQIQLLAARLGVMARSLERLEVGWDGEAHTFPMKDASGKVVGIRRRFLDGSKLSMKGGTEGCFIPDHMPSRHCKMIVICEGPTDTAALLDRDIDCIGRPNCNGGLDIIRGIIGTFEVIILADADEAGRKGAEVLANALADGTRVVKVIKPEYGKDAREWQPTKEEITKAAENAREWRRTDSTSTSAAIARRTSTIPERVTGA